MRSIKKWLIFALVAHLSGIVLAEESAPAPTTGSVVATENGGSYTYIQVSIGGSNIWYAVPATELEPGAKVFAPAGVQMRNFHSKTLDRTFDVIYFADGIHRVGSESASCILPAGHPPIQTGLPAGHPAIGNNLPPGHPPITTINTSCCMKPAESDPCRGSTNSAAGKDGNTNSAAQ